MDAPPSLVPRGTMSLVPSEHLSRGHRVVLWGRILCAILCATRMNRGGLRWTVLDGDVPLTSTDAPLAHPWSPPSADSSLVIPSAEDWAGSGAQASALALMESNSAGEIAPESSSCFACATCSAGEADATWATDRT